MAEKIISIEMDNGIIYNNPILLWPRNWKTSNRSFMQIRAEDGKVWYIKRLAVRQILTVKNKRVEIYEGEKRAWARAD